MTTTHLNPPLATVTFYESLWLKMRKQHSPLCTFTTVSTIFEVHRKIDHPDLQTSFNKKQEISDSVTNYSHEPVDHFNIQEAPYYRDSLSS